MCKRLLQGWQLSYQRSWSLRKFHCFVGYTNMVAVTSSACAQLLTDLPKRRWSCSFHSSSFAAVSRIPWPGQLPHRHRKTDHEDHWSLKWLHLSRFLPPRPIGLSNLSGKKLVVLEISKSKVTTTWICKNKKILLCNKRSYYKWEVSEFWLHLLYRTPFWSGFWSVTQRTSQ